MFVKSVLCGFGTTVGVLLGVTAFSYLNSRGLDKLNKQDSERDPRGDGYRDNYERASFL